MLSSRHGRAELRVARALAAIPLAKRFGRPWAAPATIFAVLLGSVWFWFSRQGTTLPKATPIAVALEFSAVPGNDRVPQMSIPRTGAVLFLLHAESLIPEGAIASIHTPSGPALKLTVRNQRFQLDAPARCSPLQSSI